jgi:hypothetical protein
MAPMSGTRLLNWPTAEVGVLTTKSCRLAAVVVLGLLSAAAAVVAARGMAGALQTPLETATLLTVGGLTVAAGVVVRVGWLLPLRANRINRLDVAVMAVATFAATALCSGVCSPRNTPVEIALLLRIIVVFEEGWAWLWFFRKWERNGFPPARALRQLPDCEIKTPDPFISQQLTRRESGDGVEELCGWLRLSFEPGQRTGSIHVAFCPPLRVTPELEVEQLEGPEARIKAAQVLPYGARFDLKLAAASDEAAAVLLQFTARTRREK